MRFERFLAAGLWLAACLALVAVWVAQPSWSPFLALIAAGLLWTAATRRHPTGAAVTAALPRTVTRALTAALVTIALVAAVIRAPSVVTAAYHGLRAPQYSESRADIEPLALYGSVDAVDPRSRSPDSPWRHVLRGRGRQVRPVGDVPVLARAAPVLRRLPPRAMGDRERQADPRRPAAWPSGPARPRCLRPRGLAMTGYAGRDLTILVVATRSSTRSGSPVTGAR